MPVLKQCCCCCSVRAGTYVVAIYVLVVNIIGMFGTAYLVSNPDWMRLKIRDELGCQSHPMTTQPSVSVYSGESSQGCDEGAVDSAVEHTYYISAGDLFLNVLMIALCVMMMVGVSKRRAKLMLPFITLLVFVLVFSGVLIIVMLIALQLDGAAEYALLLGLFGAFFIVHVYMTLCVISHYQELVLETRRRAPPTLTVYDTSNGPAYVRQAHPDDLSMTLMTEDKSALSHHPTVSTSPSGYKPLHNPPPPYEEKPPVEV